MVLKRFLLLSLSGHLLLASLPAVHRDPAPAHHALPLEIRLQAARPTASAAHAADAAPAPETVSAAATGAETPSATQEDASSPTETGPSETAGAPPPAGDPLPSRSPSGVSPTLAVETLTASAAPNSAAEPLASRWQAAARTDTTTPPSAVRRAPAAAPRVSDTGAAQGSATAGTAPALTSARSTPSSDRVPDARDPNHVRQQLETLLSARFVYPPLARKFGWQGEVTVRLRIGADGALEAADVVRSSGHRVLDRDAVRTLLKIGSLPNARQTLGGRALTTEIPIRYQLHEG